MEIINTKKWNDFCFFEENRVKLPRSKFDRLKKSIENKGYIICPILIMPCEGHDKLLNLYGEPTIANKHKYAVVDGQNRLLVCKELGMSVDACINSNIVRNDLVTANNTASNWTQEDYILYWHKRGRKHYTRLIELMKDYRNDFKIGVIADAFKAGPGFPSTQVLKTGEYVVSEDLGKKILDICLGMEEIDEDIYRIARFVRSIKMVLRMYPQFCLDRIKTAYDNGERIQIFNSENETGYEIFRVYDTTFPVLDTRAIPKDMKDRVLSRDKYKCSVEGCNKVDDLHVDHKKPWSKYGKTELSNLETMCSVHNQRKGNSIL